MPLLKSQKQDLWELFEAFEFDPVTVDYRRADASDSDEFRIADTKFYFHMSHLDDGVTDVSYHPAPIQHTKTMRCYSWGELRSAMVDWLTGCEREREAVDPWSVRDAVQLLLVEPIDGSDERDEELLRPEEQTSVLEALRVLESRFAEGIEELGQAADEQKLYMARQFELLRESVRTKGRGAFRQLFRDVIVSIVATVTVSLGGPVLGGALAMANDVLKALPRLRD